MNTKILSEEKIDEILSRSVYWNEIVDREESSFVATTMLRDEVVEITRSLGVKTLWILEKYAKECKNRTMQELKEKALD